MIIAPVQQPMELTLNPAQREEIKARDATLEYEKEVAEKDSLKKEEELKQDKTKPLVNEVLGRNLDVTA